MTYAYQNHMDKSSSKYNFKNQIQNKHCTGVISKKHSNCYFENLPIVTREIKALKKNQ